MPHRSVLGSGTSTTMQVSFFKRPRRHDHRSIVRDCAPCLKATALACTDYPLILRDSAMNIRVKKGHRDMRVIAAVFAVAAVFVTTPSMAQGTSAQRAACTPDVFRLCSSEIPNVEAIRSCLRTKKTSLSTDCRAVFDILDKPVQSASTRSIRPKTPWCNFSAASPDEQTWRQWCGKDAWTE